MNRLAAIQILRAVAALLVVVSHAILRQAEWAPTDPLTSQIAIHIGLLGVWIFFIISGFIMSYTYYDNFAVPGAAGQFIASRIIRIVPIYWLATALEVVLRLHHGAGLDVHKLICSLFFIPVAVEPGPMAAMRPTLGVGWTLNYEMMFYAAFASVLLLSRRKGLTVLIALMAGVVLTGTVFKPIADTRAPTSLITFYSDPIILLFGVGVLLGAAARWLKSAHAVRSNAFLLIALAMFLVVDVMLFAAFVGTHPVDVEWIATFWVISAICVVLCVTVRIDETRWLTQRLVQLGDASYSLYLFHFFAIIAAEKLWWWFFGKSESWMFVLLSAVVAILATIAIHNFVEQPIGRQLRRFSALFNKCRFVRTETVRIPMSGMPGDVTVTWNGVASPLEPSRSEVSSGAPFRADMVHRRR
ncbi:acyltransferase family protein [Bradyrhizobium sp. AZCC 1678]|uniref:acyltransferase family protein n=1 Tax=Bradyrhizobium sp. AZCC 1678 TaxID=3117030 RepID=UPI002FEE6C5E